MIHQSKISKDSQMNLLVIKNALLKKKINENPCHNSLMINQKDDYTIAKEENTPAIVSFLCSSIEFYKIIYKIDNNSFNIEFMQNGYINQLHAKSAALRAIYLQIQNPQLTLKVGNYSAKDILSILQGYNQAVEEVNNSKFIRYDIRIELSPEAISTIQTDSKYLNEIATELFKTANNFVLTNEDDASVRVSSCAL